MRSLTTTAGSWIRSAASAGCLALMLGACTLRPLGADLDSCVGGFLPTARPEGSQCLELVSTVPAVAEWVQAQGRPDYVDMPTSRVLRLLYLESDRVVEFSRTGAGSVRSAVSTPIRASDHTRFSNDDRVRLGTLRAARAGGKALEAPADGGSEVKRGIVGRKPQSGSAPDSGGEP